MYTSKPFTGVIKSVPCTRPGSNKYMPSALRPLGAFVVFVMMMTFPARAQYDADWAYTYGGRADQRVNAITETESWDLVVTGYQQEPAGQKHLWVAAMDELGNFLWDTVFTDYYSSEGKVVAEADNGDLIIAGQATYKPAFNQDMWMIRMTPDKEVKWKKLYGRIGNESATGIVKSYAGSFVLSGYTSSTKSGRNNYWLTKISEDGTQEWDHAYGGKSDDTATGLAATVDDGFILVGYTESHRFLQDKGNRMIFLVKTDSYGYERWAQTAPNSAFDNAAAIDTFTDGGYIIVGYTKGEYATDYQIIALRTDAYGNTEWVKTFGGPFWEEATDVAVTYDGGCIISGFTRDRNSDLSDFWLFKLNAAGEKIWNKIYRKQSIDHATGLIETHDRGFVAAGSSFEEVGQGWNAALLKFANIDRPDFIFHQPSAPRTITSTKLYKLRFQVRTPARLTDLDIYINGNVLTEKEVAEDAPYDSTQIIQDIDMDAFISNPFPSRNIILRAILAEDTAAVNYYPKHKEQSLERKIYLIDFEIPINLKTQSTEIVVKARNRFGVRFSKARIVNFIQIPYFRY